MEDSVVFQAGLTCVVCAALGCYVALQRPRSRMRGPVLALLSAFFLWAGGLLLVHAGRLHPGWSRLGIQLVFAGIMAAAPVWLFLCGQVARVSIVSEHRRAIIAALAVPSSLNLLALVTDPWHGLFMHGMGAEILDEPVSAWGGPLFWLHSLWGYACDLGGIALCVRALRHSSNPTERKQLALVAVAACVPGASSGLTLLGVTGGLPLTPGDLALSSFCLVVAIVRYRFLERSLIPASAVISELSDGLLLADAYGRVVDANPAAERLLGSRLAGLRGRPLAEVARDLDPTLALDTDRRSAGHSRVSREDRAYELSWGAVREVDSPAPGHFLVVRDRTEQHRQELRLRQAQRLESLGVLAAGIAHEINNPLAFVRTNLGYLRHQVERLEKIDGTGDTAREVLDGFAEVLGETESGVDRISGIVDATLKLSREPVEARSRVDLNGVVAEAVRLASLHAHGRAEVLLQLASALPPVRGSADRLRQLVINLLINAKQAAGPRGRIQVETRHAKGRAEVSVHDDGPGVSSEQRDRIFDPFFTTKGPDEGTGLGLAIAFEIACQHDGTVGVETSELLGGACFRLSLPAD